MTAIVFLWAFAFLAAGTSGTIPVYRDSGDLIASVSTFGIAHPPGYPLYVTIGHLFQWLVPFGNLAYRLNLCSAFWAALALTLLYRLLAKRSRLAAATAVILFAFSPALLALAHVSEMYTFALFLGILMLAVSAEPTLAHTCAGFFILGLAMGVHPTLLLLAPALWRSRARPWFPALFFLAGFSIVLFLPLRSLTHPLFNWGHPDTWRNFWRVLTRADYGGWKLHPVESSLHWTPLGVGDQLFFFLKALSLEWGWGALLVAAGGAFWAWRKQGSRLDFWLVCGAFLLSGPLFFLVSNLPLTEETTPAILQPYLLVPGIFVAGALAYGLAMLWNKNARIALVAMGLALSGLARTHDVFHARHDFLAYDYGRNVLRELPPQAVLYDPDDPTSFTVRSLQVMEHRRLDVVPLNFFRTLWGYEEIRQHTALLPDFPISNAQELERVLWEYARLRQPFYAELPQKFEGRPYAAEGLVYAAYPPDPKRSLMRAETNLELMVRRDFSQTVDHHDFFARHLVSYYAAAHCNLGLDEANAHLSDRAAFHYEMALAIDPTLSVAYTNWGTLAFNQKKYQDAATLYRAGLAIAPNDAGLQSNLALALAQRK